MSTQSTGLRAKVMASTKLSTLQFASQIGLRLVSTIILTRLLAPEIYGVFAIVLVYLYIFEMFSDLGIRSLILTKEGHVENSFLRTCWTVSILRGLLIAAIAGLVALGISALQGMGTFAADNPYSASDLPWALAALGATVIITSLQSPAIFMYERNMAFGRVTVLTIGMNVFALIVTIILAYALRSVWALVLGNVARAILMTSLSFVLFKGPRMGLRLHPGYLKLVIDRGKWIVGHSILTALSQSGDRLVLGFMMTSSTFGFYYIARQLVDVVLKFLMSIDMRIGLQVFTHLQKHHSTDQFRRNYYRYRLFFDAIAGLSTGVLIVISPLVIELLFDDRYQGVAPIAQILIWGVLLVGPLLLRSAFSAERRFREMTLLSVVSTVTLWVGLGAALFFFDSIYIALVVIALHRMPEAMICTLIGGDRDWVIIWREFLGFGFCAIGIALSWGALALWQVML